MKFKDHALFLISALILCFPIGLILVILSNQTVKRKWLLCIIGLLASTLLLLTALFPISQKKAAENLEIIATRNELSIGQSGGFSVASNDAIETEFKVHPQNDCLTVHDNIYTAVKPGKCELKITCGEKTKSIEILVTEEDRTDETVFSSPTASRYHSKQTHAGKNNLKMTEEDALQSGKTPCMICYK